MNNKIFGCKGTNCPLKKYCKKYTNYTKDRYTTSYFRIPYNHVDKKCINYEPYEDK